MIRWLHHALFMTLLCQSMHQARSIHLINVYRFSLYDAEGFMTGAAAAWLRLMALGPAV